MLVCFSRQWVSLCACINKCCQNSPIKVFLHCIWSVYLVTVSLPIEKHRFMYQEFHPLKMAFLWDLHGPLGSNQVPGLCPDMESYSSGSWMKWIFQLGMCSIEMFLKVEGTGNKDKIILWGAKLNVWCIEPYAPRKCVSMNGTCCISKNCNQSKKEKVVWLYARLYSLGSFTSLWVCMLADTRIYFWHWY